MFRFVCKTSSSTRTGFFRGHSRPPQSTLKELLMIIPARGGSRGIPRKNITPVAGKPLIAWTITAALASSLGRVIVSTDDDEIAAIARDYGAEVPFLRPSHLAADDTPGIEPLLHAVTWMETNAHYAPDYVMLLQPTSPLRETCDIEDAFKLGWERQADAVVSLCEAREHPYWMKKVAEDGTATDFLPTGEEYSARQSLPKLYRLNGAIYLVRRQVLISERTVYPQRTLAYLMPTERSIDIDTPWDLYLLRLILANKQTNEVD
jgi:CMP-N,N'-diacetyllegionaminic acid synthase